MGRSLETDGATMGWMPPWFYDAFVAVLTVGREDRHRREILDVAAIQPGDRILDVGCGTGTLAVTAAEDAGPSGRVVGVDANSAFVRSAAKKARRRGLDLDRVEFKEGVAESLPAEDASFDLVLCTLVIHHLPGYELQKRAFGEMMRVLAPGGRLLVVDFPGGHGHHGHSKGHGHGHGHGHHGHFHCCGEKDAVDTENDPLVKLVKEHGFAVDASQQVRMLSALAVLAHKPRNKPSGA